ncbi:F-box protein GID2-like [Rutidosis leptorrhynchoides]|uniref:F-box protein GID2-like n=1 Tax=Rutidosis leptorrhynchoides TaxID=125765 RepID=UPI003A997F38
MKRSGSGSVPVPEHPIENKSKKLKSSSTENLTPTTSFPFDDNLLYEILKHVDAKTLGAVSCVSKQFNRTANDERLWEMICTQHWMNNMTCNNNQLRSVVLALGGFRRLHAHYLWPLSKPTVSTVVLPSCSTTVAAATAWPSLAPQPQPQLQRPIALSKPNSPKTRWGKDEVQLSLSLLSIRYYEKMNFRNRK